MEELRFALLILGGFAIIAILAHGLWSLRKNNKLPEKTYTEPMEKTSDTEGFDQFGVGEVRVVNPESLTKAAEQQGTAAHNSSRESLDHSIETPNNVEPVFADQNEMADQHPDIEPDNQAAIISDSAEDIEPQPEPTKLYGSVVSNPKPSVSSTKAGKASDVRVTKTEHLEANESNSSIPEPPPFLLHTESVLPEETANQQQTDEPKPESKSSHDEVASFSLDQSATQPEHDNSLVSQTKRMVSRKRGRTVKRKRVEPSLGEDQMRIDFDNSQQMTDDLMETPEPEQKPDRPAENAPEQEVLVLNVKAPNEQEINGSALLPMLLTLGFKFGDQDIFHRHVNSNGKGPVLFSLANMFKPGVFDIDNLENFTTQGVSLFMILPIEGDPHQVFNMMHNAARKLADEFACQIMDGRRSVLTKQGLQQYVEKIREFERQRIIARS